MKQQINCFKTEFLSLIYSSGSHANYVQCFQIRLASVRASARMEMEPLVSPITTDVFTSAELLFLSLFDKFRNSLRPSLKLIC